MSASDYCPPLIQLAFSVVDLRRTERWFHDGLGFLPSGGNMRMMSGPLASRVQGIPRVASCAWWMVARNRWFQLEMFQFRRPIAALMPADFRPCDIGYTRMGVHVHDFDAALANLAQLGSVPLGGVQGEPGSRRACVRNPDGVYVEIMEDDPLPQAPGGEREGCPVAVRSVTMSTPDLEASVAYLTAVNGHGPEAIDLHTPEHEALWGLSGATCKRAIFRSGDILLEIVQYLDPVGVPRSADYCLSDQGILNVAYGARTKSDHTRIYDRAMAFGARPNCRPLHFNGGGIVYMNDNMGFSVEATWMPAGKHDLKYGFEPVPRDQRPQHDKLQVAGRVNIAAPVAVVWAILNDQDAMAQWIGFDTVQRTRDGVPGPNDYGAQRAMRGRPGRVIEQITGIDFHSAIRYRVIDGGPLQFHNGEIRLRPTSDGTEVAWSIRFRNRYPLTGALLRAVMQKMLDAMLHGGLKPHAERIAATEQRSQPVAV